MARGINKVDLSIEYWAELHSISYDAVSDLLAILNRDYGLNIRIPRVA